MNNLAASEEAFFFERSLDLLAVVGLDGYFKRINLAFTQTLGYAQADFLARPFIDFVHPDDRAATWAEFEKLAAGVPIFHFENRYRTKDGASRWLAWTGSPQLDRGVAYCVARDVTQQKQMEAALRISEERWQLALRGSNDGIWDWNVQTNEVFFSTRWKTMLGYEEHEISNRLEEWSKRVHPDDLAAVMQLIQAHFDRKTPFYISEHRVLCKDGTYKWTLDRGQAIWNEAGAVLRMVGSHTDITARRELEAALKQMNQQLEQHVAERTAQLTQANVALQESEERNQLAMEVARMFTFEWEPTTDGVKRSPQCSAILGLTDAAIEQDTGANFFQRIHPDDRDRFVAGLKTLSPTHSTYKTTYRVVRPDQQIVSLEESGRAWFDAQGQLIRLIGITVDVTERQRLEAELKESSAILQRQLAEIETIYRSAPIGLNVLDADLRFVRINQRLAEINGFSVEEHLGRTVQEVLPELAETAEALLRPIFETGEPLLNVEIRGETPAQPGIERVWLESFLPLKDGDRVIGINTVCQEITERKKIEATLRESRERLRLAMQVSGFALAKVDYITNQVELSAEAATLYGFAAQALTLTRQQLHQTFHPDDWTELSRLIEQSLDPDRTGVFVCDHRVVWQSGEVKWLSVRKQIFFDRSSPVPKPTYGILVALDITDRKRLLQQEQVAREAAERANRMKDEFLAILSHELRTPLNPILGWAKLLQTPQISAERLQQGLMTIERNAKQQVQLIEDLLDISRSMGGKLTLNFMPIDLTEPITAALETVRLAAEAKAIRLEVWVDTAARQIHGDMGRLQQVVWNLLSNAIKFTPTGGQVTVRLSQVDRHAQIQVTDTGRGIAPHFLPHVFELFQQQDSSTTRSFGGLGLGLAIARHLVEAHGGTIWADSPGENQGTTFTMRLPLLEIEPQNPVEESCEPELDLTGIRVLIVDDEPDARQLMTVLLSQYGAEVLTVDSAAEVLANLEDFRPHVLVSDLGMPKMDGYDLIRQVRALPTEQGGTIPAIALSAYAREEDYQRTLRSGYQRHLSKPLEPTLLVRTVTALVHSESMDCG